MDENKRTYYNKLEAQYTILRKLKTKRGLVTVSPEGPFIDTYSNTGGLSLKEVFYLSVSDSNITVHAENLKRY